MTKVFEPELVAVGAGIHATRLCAPNDFAGWLKLAKPGDRIIYALAFWLPKRAFSATVAAAQDAYDEGLISLFQKSLGRDLPGHYIAVRNRWVMLPSDPFTPRRGSNAERMATHNLMAQRREAAKAGAEAHFKAQGQGGGR